MRAVSHLRGWRLPAGWARLYASEAATGKRKESAPAPTMDDIPEEGGPARKSKKKEVRRTAVRSSEVGAGFSRTHDVCACLQSPDEWKFKRDYVRAVVEAHYDRTPNPMIAQVMQKRMIEASKQAPAAVVRHC